MNLPEPWLRGAVDGVISGLQPVAHALLFAREELDEVLPRLNAERVWGRPGNIAPVGYHVRHCFGSVERMLTYLDGRPLSEEQLVALASEKLDVPEMDGDALLQLSHDVIDRALEAIRATTEEQLDQPRVVGRKQLPSSVRGLFFEIALHTARHVGQIVTTAKLV
jgi:hypothetical protein